MTKPSKVELIRIAAEEDLLTFIKLVAPHRVLGDCHKDLIRWWTREDAKDHQLTLLPRDHQKSAMIAYRVVWEITRNPAVTILYISSTSNLAEKQLKFIKDILDSKIYRRYWPEMLHPDEGKREKWSSSEISVDHPNRKREGVRDPTVFTAGLTTSITGLHCNIAVLDDAVVQENAYTNEGRAKVKSQYSLLASIETAGAKEWVVGTRYHPDDLYGEMLEMQRETYTEDGELDSSEAIYELYQREVEDQGDGTGEYLWPRAQRADGKWFGFNQQIIATKRAQYLDKTQFRAQYYNNPNDPDNERISSDFFQYYDRKYLEQVQGVWHYRNNPLNVFAAIDFAFSLGRKADFTAIAVIGIAPDGMIYVMDIDRFRTNRISDYFEKIIEMHSHWGFRKLRAEVTVAQEAIVEELKERIRQGGFPLSIDKYRPTRNEGTKEERIYATLAPRYENYTIWHYKGGVITDLEQELRMEHSRNDDLKDALTNAIAIAVAPRQRALSKDRAKVIPIHSRFGGVAFR